MKLVSRVLVLGATFFEGEIDGKMIDTGSIFTMAPFSDSRGQSGGSRTIEMKCSSSKIVRDIVKAGKFPCDCNIEIEQVVGKNSDRFVCVSLTVVGQK